MNKILGIDYGSKRIGVAIADSKIQLIKPLPIIQNQTQTIWHDLKRAIQENDIDAIVIGYPSTADGRKISLHKQIDSFILYIQKHYPDISIHTVDEAFSSQEAGSLLLELDSRHSPKRRKKHKEKLDSVAASILLKNFLNL